MMDAIDPNWPYVMFRGSALTSRGVTEQDVASLANQLIEELLGESTPIVSKIVVADFAEYGAAIRTELNADVAHTHTDRQQYKGMGITVNNNIVVICAGAVAAALDIDDVEPIMPPFLGRYMLQHEFAHCYDHGVRPPTALVRAERTVLYCLRILPRRNLMAEFAACGLCGETLTEEAFKLLCEIDAGPLEDEVEKILKLRTDFCVGGDTDLGVVAFEASQLLWLILLQYTKVFGHMYGGKKPSAPIAFPRSIVQSGAIDAIHALARLLGEKVADYPNWPEDGWDELDDIWDQLAVSLGFRFEIAEDSLALWFD